MIETRHSHSGNWHDHPDGGLPHDHGYRTPHDPAAEPRRQRPPGLPRGNGASAAFGFGTVFIVFGAIGMLVASNSHAACNSVLVQAASQSGCPEANAVWTLGIIGLVLGVVLIIVGAILRGKSSLSCPHERQRSRPGWPLFGRQTTLNAATYCAPVSIISAGQQRNAQIADARDTVYGSALGTAGAAPYRREKWLRYRP